MQFNWKWLCGYWSKEGGWLRLGTGGEGLVLTRACPLFSERNGYIKSLKLFFGWRIRFLSKPTKTFQKSKEDNVPD